LLFIIIVKKESRKSIQINDNWRKINLDKNKDSHNKNLNFKRFPIIKKKLQNKVIYIFIFFIISIICLCISSSLYTVSDPKRGKIRLDYRENFMFFYRVHFIFFIFLTTSIILLTLILFYSKNLMLILTSISIFLYCLWILPYLQIRNYFGHDIVVLLNSFKIYQSEGIKANSNSNFIFGELNLRYSTHIFTAIILKHATGVNIHIVLWFIYPLIFTPVPFFFYSIFEKFSIKDKNQNHKLILLTILQYQTVQFLKVAHSASTMVLGIYIYFI